MGAESQLAGTASSGVGKTTGRTACNIYGIDRYLWQSQSCATWPHRELQGRDFENMRNRARRVLFLRGGALDLAGDEPVLLRWGVDDSTQFLFFGDEVLSIDCPYAVADFGHHNELLSVIRTAYPQYWPVVIEVVLQTLKAVQHRRTLVICGPHRSLKTALFATFLRLSLTDVLCPVAVDPFILSQRWSNTANSAPDKRAAERSFGRSLFRLVDDAERQNGRSKFSVHLATIRKQQAGTDTFTPPGKWTITVPTRTLPLFVLTTNEDVEELFTELPRAMDQRDKMLVIDTHRSALDETGPNYDKLVAEGVFAACTDCEGNPSRYSKQLCSLLCWWMSSPPERCNMEAMFADCTLDAYLARRDAVPLVQGKDARIETLKTFLGAPEDTDNHALIRVEGRSGIKRRDIYAKAGVDFCDGGKPASEAAEIVDHWVERKYGIKSETLPGGYAGYKGIALSR